MDYGIQPTKQFREQRLWSRLELYYRFLLAIRAQEYPIIREKGFVGWVDRFLGFHNNTLPDSRAELQAATFFRAFGYKTQDYWGNAQASEHWVQVWGVVKSILVAESFPLTGV